MSLVRAVSLTLVAALIAGGLGRDGSRAPEGA